MYAYIHRVHVSAYFSLHTSRLHWPFSPARLALTRNVFSSLPPRHSRGAPILCTVTQVNSARLVEKVICAVFPLHPPYMIIYLQGSPSLKMSSRPKAVASFSAATNCNGLFLFLSPLFPPFPGTVAVSDQF